VLGEVDRERTWLERSLESAGFPFETIRKRASAYLAVSRAIRRRLRTMRPSVVHTHAYKADVLTRLALPSGSRHVVTAHGFTEGDIKNRLYEWLDRQVMKRADAVIAVSDALARQLERDGVDPQRIHHVPNGAVPPPLLDRDQAQGELRLDPSLPAIGWIGRLSYEKGPDIFVESVPLISPPAQFVLIGAGPLEAAIRTRARELAPSHNIKLVGQKEDAAKYLKAFDLLVLSSRTEGSPIIVAEALQAGIPIVAPAVGDIPRLAHALGTIELVQPGDSRGLAEKIQEAVGNLRDRRSRAEQARAKAGELVGAASWVQAISQVYRLESTADSGEDPAS